ncbi:rhodanese-like domain-containing protein [Acidovorax sp. SUPP950]|uniref:rhodanese-like domain-containing protein n=1 Tax=Acidovorax sp. SUPP950 TaxID=511901 RepID=UPI0023C9C400|nr:rhodanese-like domain-containing protein [Acidovorax sp. SUPP950]GKS77384.1 rhodanese-like domain-containing protein [Acidovorax sp. SUPP950]
MRQTLHKTAVQLVADANEQIESLSVEELDAEIQSNGLVLLDVREADEYRVEAIPGALLAARGMLEFYADPTSNFHRYGLQPTQRVVLYCGSGGRSALAALALKSMGYSRVAQLRGGFKAWKAEGKACTRDIVVK